MNGTLFGIIEFEKDPPRFDYFWRYFESWAQDAGGFAALALLMLAISQFFARDNSRTVRFNTLMRLFSFVAFIGYAVYIAIMISGSLFPAREQMRLDGVAETSFKFKNLSKEGLEDISGKLLMFSGLAAMIAFATPFFIDLFKMRFRRIFALAKLSFVEAMRRKIFWVFLAFLIVFLFPAKWFFSIKAEDEVRSSVSVVHYVLEILLVPISLMLAAFSIPNDVKNQTIHTVVTKPVERFEILLGRFIGYMSLMTVALFGLTAISYVLISASKIDPLAAEESMKARLPKYGVMDFLAKQENFVGVDVGNEKTYRKFIAGGPTSSHRGLYSFSDISGLSSMSAVPCEFAFDIYRLTKGEENRGIQTSFDFRSWKYDSSPAREAEYDAAVRDIRNAQPPEDESDTIQAERWKKANEVARKFGRYEFKGFPMLNYHTYGIKVPPALFENAASGTPPKVIRKFTDGSTEEHHPYVFVYVHCDSPSQMLGIAQYDLYFLEAEGKFSFNYFKGVVGIWCRLALAIGLAVVFSTYFAGIISLLLAFFLFLLGYFTEFLVSLATKTNPGGGPMEALTKLVRGDVAATPLENSPVVSVVLFADDIFRWFVRRFFNIVPDIDRFVWANYVSEGFSIRPELMAVNILFLIGYLLPWFLIGYYLLKTREIAA